MNFITKPNFKKFVEQLINGYTLYGTADKDGFPAFSKIERFDELKLNQTPTHIPAKGLLFPPKEVLVKFDREKDSAKSVIEWERQAIIGLHSCDIHAISLMDKVFAYSTPDVNYLKRRENTVLIGTECIPDKHCFCPSIGTMETDEGFDIFLHEVKNGFLVRTGTVAGEKLIKRYAVKAKNRQIEELNSFTEGKKKLFKTRLDAEPSELPLIYAASEVSPVWEKIGAICYGCGSCNNVCPTCYCFDVKDAVSPDLKKIKRSRTWDACTLEDFAKIAGSINFRKTRAARLKHRFNRKFRYLTNRFKGLFCVGCGRCSRTCLVLINIAEVTNELIKESKERIGCL